MLNSRNTVHIGGGRDGLGQVKLFVGNSGSSRVSVSPGRVGSNEMTREQLRVLGNMVLNRSC